jgi:hypothetical protein
MEGESVTVSKTYCCSCKKLICDTTQNICCYFENSHMYFDNFEDIPLTTYICNVSSKACRGEYGLDDIRCFCGIFSPITCLLDLISCPFRMCCYTHYKRINGKGIPCYIRDDTEQTKSNKDTITSQPT